jgi:hypothetical protein
MTATARVRPPRGAVIGVLVGGGLLLAALAGGPPGRDGPPLDPRSDGPLGTSALVSLLEGLGAEVELSVGLPRPTDDVALVLEDRLDEEQTDAIVGWVRAGGTLIVTDPGSSLTPPFDGIGVSGLSRTLEPGSCSIAALESVGDIEAGAAVRFQVGSDDQLCFGDREDGAFVVTRTAGRGDVVAVGGAAFVTNELLDERDNAVLAAALLAPARGTAVRFVDAPVPAGGGDKTLGDLVPAGVERGLLQLAIAFVVYAAWRAIRLGQPVVEDQPVEVAGSELVAAVGRLLARTHAPGVAAETLRGELRRALRTRLGVPPSADATVLASVVAARTRLELEQVLEAIDERPVTTDAELGAVARAVASVQQEVLR